MSARRKGPLQREFNLRKKVINFAATYCVYFALADAYAVINGSPELYIKNGSEMHLTCKFVHSTEEPSFVFWYHENSMINFDQSRGISTFKNKTGSSLTIPSINHAHSGNYSCVPSNIKPASVSVHILDGKNFYGIV